MMVKVRAATAEDSDGIADLHRACFPTAAEAELVAALTAAGDALISLVAEDDGRIVGHALLSRVDAEADGKVVAAMALAPVAVGEDCRGQGIGEAVVHAGLRTAEARGADIVFVVGDPQYYRRFGFDTATAAPFRSAYSGPHFQALVLRPGFRLPRDGTADYAPAFAALR